MVLPDHYTLSMDGTHHPRPVPVLVAGHGVVPSGDQRYSEAVCADRPVVIGTRLLGMMLHEPEIRWDAELVLRANRGEEALEDELESEELRVSGGMRG